MNTNTEKLNDKVEAVFTTVAAPIVRAAAEAEPVSKGVNYIMLGVGVLFFLLAFYINFFL